MEEWMKTPVSQLKKLVKSRAGRVAELQMEIKILEGIIERKVSQGDLGGSMPRQSTPKIASTTRAEPSMEDKLEEEVNETSSEKSETHEAGEMNPETEKKSGEGNTEQTKITAKSSDHAFKEID